MTTEQLRKEIHTGIDRHCAPLTSDPYLMQKVLRAANAKGERGGRKTKKRIPLALALGILLLCVTAGAGAAMLLWRDYVPQMKQEEHELGDYAEWPDAQRIQLAKDILAMGYLEDSEDTRILSDETATEQEKAAAADRLMLQLTGEDDVREVHSTLITYAIMGHEDTWTPAQRAWWNGIITMYGDDGAPDTLIVPTEEDLPEEEAVRIARAAVMEAYGFDEAYMDELTPVADLYVTDARPDYKRWVVQFKKYREGSDHYLEKNYSVVVDENGEVIADPDIGIDLPESMAAYASDENTDKAETVNPKTAEVYSLYGSQVNGRNVWRLSMVEKAAMLGEDNGIPGEGAIDEAEAVRIARNRLASIGYDLDSYAVSVWYKLYDRAATDISASDPFYIVYFLDDTDSPENVFSVTLDAADGEIRDTFTPGTVNH